MARKARGPAKLPVQQLSILAVCRFAEPLASTSVFPYLPEMIESFGVDENNVAKWAGITSAVFSLAQCCTAVAWGRASDKFGRKPVILIGLSITMCTSLFWGLSQSLTWAIVARALSGGGNGNVGIIRTMVAEMVQDHKELQPRAFSVMPLVWSIGSIFGPAFGGFFANPAENLPGLFGGNKLFIKFPFALPNMIAAVFFSISITVGYFFLKETLETKKNKPDFGIFLGKKIVRFLKQKKAKHFRPTLEFEDDVSAPLLRPTSSMTNSTAKSFDEEWQRSETKTLRPPPSIGEVLTRQSTINLIAYTFLALHSVAFDQLLPTFMHLAPQVPDSSNTRLPFKFSGGFGLGSGRIGTLFTLFGVFGGFVQFIIFPPVARRYGVLKCLKVCSITFPFVFFATPYTALIQNPIKQQATMFCIMMVKSFAGIFAFPCSTILLTNSALSLRVLGTLNGFATSISAIGRASGPAIGGGCFTWGVEAGYMITPWWTLGAIAALGAIPVWFLEEMDGFNASSDNSDDEDEEDEDDEMILAGIAEEDLAIIHGDEFILPDPSEQAIDTVEGPSLNEIGSRSPAVLNIHRRLSSPIGVRNVGPGGGRRLSNGLGQTNYGTGTGGTVFY